MHQRLLKLEIEKSIKTRPEERSEEKIIKTRQEERGEEKIIKKTGDRRRGVRRKL